MFLMIHESGDVVKLQDITADDVRAADDGVVALIDITNKNYPTQRAHGEWLEITGCGE